MFKLPIFVDFSACEVSVKRRCLVSGDYNSTELEFSFDKEYEGTKVFEMKSPSGELRMVKTITDNKIVLVGDNGASLFDEAGRYVFEISLYSGDSKLTSSSGFLLVDKEQVVIDGEIVEPYLPVFDELLNEVSEALEETSNLNIEAVKIGKTTTVTFTDKEGSTKEIEIKDGEDLPEYTFGNGLTKVGNEISVNTLTIATVTKAQQLANSAYEDALADIEDEVAVREEKDAETLASAKDYTDTKVNAHKSEVNNTVAQLNTRIDGKQNTLVSGTNIKTVNGTSLLGSGNIEIQGGGSYTFTDGISESGGTVSADMEYIEEALYDSIGEIVDMTGTPRNNQILIGASNTNPTIKASGKTLTDLQDKLVSGTNIKTINNESLLGEGNIEIQGGVGAGVLIVNYNTQAVDDIADALSNGITVVLNINGNNYAPLVRADATRYYFLSADLSSGTRQMYWYYVSRAQATKNTWGSEAVSFEMSNNKTQSISSSSTATQFPSAKAVYDFVESKTSGQVVFDQDVTVYSSGSEGYVHYRDLDERPIDVTQIFSQIKGKSAVVSFTNEAFGISVDLVGALVITPLGAPSLTFSPLVTGQGATIISWLNDDFTFAVDSVIGDDDTGRYLFTQVASMVGHIKITIK